MYDEDKLLEDTRRRKNLKKLEDERHTGGKTHLRKSEARQNIGNRQEKCKTRKGLKTNIRRWGRGCQVRCAFGGEVDVADR